MSRGSTLFKLLVFAGAGWAVARWRESRRDDEARSLPRSLPPAGSSAGRSTGPSPIDASWVPGPAGSLRVLSSGEPRDEPAFLLVHGLGGSADAWRGVMDHLRGVRVAAVDLPGHGESEWSEPEDADAPLGMEALAGSISAAADGLGLRRYVLVAHSLGAQIALAAAAKNPRRVAGLFLVDPNGDASRIPEAQRQSLLEALEDDAHGELEGQFRQFLGGADPDVRDRVLESLRDTPGRVLASFYAATLSLSPVPDLDRYREAGGKVGAVITPWNDLPFSLHRIRRDLPVAVAHDVSHWLMMDEPENLARMLADFAGEVGAVH